MGHYKQSDSLTIVFMQVPPYNTSDRVVDDETIQRVKQQLVSISRILIYK